MDWTTAIEKHRDALKGIVAALVAMAAGAGLVSRGDAPATLPRHLHRAVLRLLRPAESAARRLAIALARALPTTVLRPRKAGPTKSIHAGARKASSLLVRDGLGTGIVLRPGAPVPAHLAHLVSAKAAPRPLSFPLLDPLPRWRVRRPWQPATGAPRISMAGVTEPLAVPAWRPPQPDDLLDAGASSPAARRARPRTRRSAGAGQAVRALESAPRPGARRRPHSPRYAAAWRPAAGRPPGALRPGRVGRPEEYPRRRRNPGACPRAGPPRAPPRHVMTFPVSGEYERKNSQAGESVATILHVCERRAHDAR